MSFTFKLEQDKNIQRPQKVYFFLLGLLFLVAPFYYQPNLGGEGLFIPHNSALWLVVLTIITSASWLIFTKKEIALPRYWLGLALLPLGAIITGYIADNNNPVEWLVRISVIIGGYLFLISLFQFKLNTRMAELGLYLVVVMGLISASFGLIQLQSAESFGFKFLPISPKNIPFGNFQQINLQASLMATVLVTCFYLASRPSHINRSCIINMFLIVSTLCASYILALSGSRVGALGAITGLFILFLGRWKIYVNHHKLATFLLILATSIGGLLGQSGIHQTTEKFEQAIGGMDLDIRWKVYNLSWELFTEEPFTGHGVGSYQKVFQEKRAEAHTQETLSLGSALRFSHPHNELIFWMVEGGIVSIVGILAAAIVTFIQLSKLGYQRGLGYAALLVPIVLHTQVELPFYISNTHWLLLLFLLYLAHQPINKKVSTRNMSRAAQITLPTALLIIALYGGYQLITAQIANSAIVKHLKQKDPALLLPAIEHFYFRDYATYLLYRLGMINGMRSGNTEHIKNFIDWAEKALQTSPALETYRDLAAAYHSIGMHEKRDETLAKGLNIYLNHKELLKLKQAIRKDEK